MKSPSKNMAEEPEEDEIGTGEETKAERVVSNKLGVVIHFFSFRTRRAAVDCGGNRRF